MKAAMERASRLYPFRAVTVAVSYYEEYNV